MANLGKKNGVYLARFRYQGKEYKRSLKTDDSKVADLAMHRVEAALQQLALGLKQVPDGVDPGDYIVSGGTLEAPKASKPRREAPALEKVIEEYLENLGHLAPSNRYTIGVHLRNLQRTLGARAKVTIDRIEQRDLEAFLQKRLKEVTHTTVSKERDTVVQLFGWAVGQGYLEVSPAADLTKVKTGGELPPFRTVAEIEAIIQRGGLGQDEEWALWDCLYLTPPEIAEVLALVRGRAKDPLSFILHAVPAYTGMRRGEVLRLRWQDVELEQNGLTARSKKQSRQTVEVRRRIDLHPELKALLVDWQQQRPRGQLVACEAEDLTELTVNQAVRYFQQPLRGTRWCLSSRRNRFKIGYHTYRHSFASNLAAAGIDERVIDELMGHTTEGMRKRYRHLHPASRRAAVESFSFAQPGTAGPTGPVG